MVTDLRAAAAAASAATLANGGVTLRRRDLSQAELSAGYAVGGSEPSVIVPPVADVLTRAILAFAERSHAEYVGTWAHEGKVYLDAVDVVADRAAALALARARGERAIYDFGSGAEVAAAP